MFFFFDWFVLFDFSLLLFLFDAFFFFGMIFVINGFSGSSFNDLLIALGTFLLLSEIIDVWNTNHITNKNIIIYIIIPSVFAFNV